MVHSKSSVFQQSRYEKKKKFRVRSHGKWLEETDDFVKREGDLEERTDVCEVVGLRGCHIHKGSD